jgi:type I restriction enzyme R subunit
MNIDNFLARPRRFLVEQYAQPQAWTKLTDEARATLAHEVAGLPSETETEPEETKRFDLLMFNLELALLRKKPDFKRLRKQVELLAALLEEKKAIPMVNAQMALILEVQTDDWWQDVTLPMLESVRRRLRELVKLIEKQSRKPLYADFDDHMDDAVEVALPAFAAVGDFERFRAKSRSFLREHQDHVTVAKLRMNRPLTPSDLGELERILVENGVGGPEEIEHAISVAQSLGLFVRSLIGLDREAAKEALATFLAGKTLSSNQIEFVNLIVDHLTERGVVEPAALYEAPFTDLTPHGPDAIFTEAQIEELMAVLEGVKATAVAW